ncbi:hypothetical protein TREMEDRAFT_66619, partial [Tremella mesenterica DSM 1558]|uniref:uncharacterized protein n=1 Tax=Tremella mesenterica (strain ATCC 24925 / CBS 8224 / DSM 1558 / NBRC 9311 / NRRL Y-6157 / RJB 2259-6 / UBC 559-6) TaxID=578456 RepID=UPI00032BBCB2
MEDDWEDFPFDDNSSNSDGGNDDDTKQQEEYIIVNGDHYFPHHIPSNIPPFTPHPTSLPEPNTILPEIDLENIRPPKENPFPENELDEVLSSTQEEVTGTGYYVSEDSWARNWEKPKVWDEERGEIRKVQWEGFDGIGTEVEDVKHGGKGGKGGKGNEERMKKWRESKKRRKLREERKQAVRRGFIHAWQGYKDHAWGHDEVKPVSQQPSNPFNNWGATIIDSLDTLLLLGFPEEYTLCRPHINQLNFHWISGRDWRHPYISPTLVVPTTDPDSSSQPLTIHRDHNIGLPVFETGIRYLGGLLGAYDLTGDQLLLDRAIDLAHILGRAFDTDSGLPAGRIDPGSPGGFRLGSVSAAEVGSMTLELIRLSQITKDRQWFDLSQRAIDFIENRIIPRVLHPPLVPLWFTPNSPFSQQLNGAISFGGLADSYYEYLIKTYKLLGGTTVSKQYSKLYSDSIDTARKVLLYG